MHICLKKQSVPHALDDQKGNVLENHVWNGFRQQNST